MDASESIQLKAEGNETVTNCHVLKMTAADGKKRITGVADAVQLNQVVTQMIYVVSIGCLKN